MNLLGHIRQLLGGTPAQPAQEPLVHGHNALLCVCDEEWCFCTNLAPVAADAIRGLALLGAGWSLGNNPCADCRDGKHVWSPPPR